MGEIVQVCEENLQRMAEEEGPASPPAAILRNLAKKRAKDRQVFVWQLGQYYFVGPTLDAEMEAKIRQFIVVDDEEAES